jgi:hypothetical protein
MRGITTSFGKGIKCVWHLGNDHPEQPFRTTTLNDHSKQLFRTTILNNHSIAQPSWSHLQCITKLAEKSSEWPLSTFSVICFAVIIIPSSYLTLYLFFVIAYYYIVLFAFFIIVCGIAYSSDVDSL